MPVTDSIKHKKLNKIMTIYKATDSE